MSHTQKKYFPFYTDEELRGNVGIREPTVEPGVQQVQGKRAFIRCSLKGLSSLLLLVLFSSFLLGVQPAVSFLYRLPFYYFLEIKSFASNGSP